MQRKQRLGGGPGRIPVLPAPWPRFLRVSGRPGVGYSTTLLYHVLHMARNALAVPLHRGPCPPNGNIRSDPKSGEKLRISRPAAAPSVAPGCSSFHAGLGDLQTLQVRPPNAVPINGWFGLFIPAGSNPGHAYQLYFLFVADDLGIRPAHS